MTNKIPAPPAEGQYVPDEIILYGVRLNEDRGRARIALPFAGAELELAVVPADEAVAIIVAYGFAYEGHCYRLDKPRVLVAKHNGPEATAVGCGFENLGYKMWRIRKGEHIADLVVGMDTADDLLLDANLPGNRAPNTYGNAMNVAHRGGRLTRMGE